jgi:hypothetical protein
MTEFINAAKEGIDGLIEKKINDLKFDEIFKSQIVPKLEAAIEAGVKTLFESARFQETAANMFKSDLFKIYDAALKDCAVVQKIIEKNNTNTDAAFFNFIQEIKEASGDEALISKAKQVFLEKMAAINTENTGGASIKKIQELKDSFAKQADKISSPAVSQVDPVSGETMIDMLEKIKNKSLNETQELQNRKQELETNMLGGGKSKKRLGGGKSKKRRKRTYKRR